MTSTADRSVEELGGPPGVLVRIREGADDRTRPGRQGENRLVGHRHGLARWRSGVPRRPVRPRALPRLPGRAVPIGAGLTAGIIAGGRWWGSTRLAGPGPDLIDVLQRRRCPGRDAAALVLGAVGAGGHRLAAPDRDRAAVA